MTKNILHFGILFIVMVLLQIVCSKILLFDLATPLIFIYFIIRLPMNLSKNWVYTLSFFLGLVVDIFNNTQGMNALACTLMSALRQPVFNIYMPREDDMSNPIPSIQSLGTGVYLKYMITLVVIFCLFIFMIQSFTFSNVALTLLRALCSSVLTIVILFGIDSLMSTRREKRL
ncbi:MAG: rod shape-determining protein MreD [Muribaculaceae bacterium]|nr:rod shape-determining protein MreD [Muribaculaceae bacterium]